MIHKRNVKTVIKVFAFFGADVKGKAPDFLRKVQESGYSLLPLDSPAIGTASKSGAPYRLIDDWLSPEVMAEARKSAAECEKKWFEGAKEKFAAGGICWPEFDREAMYWFWQDVTSASLLAEAFIQGGVQDLSFFQNSVQRPAIYYKPSDTIFAFWKEALGDKANVFIVRPKTLWHRAIRHRFSKLRCKGVFRNKSGNDFQITNPSLLRRKVVLAFHHGEFSRLTLVIQQLSQRYPEKLAAIILSSNQADADKISSKWSIPVFCCPPPASIDPDLQEKFLCAYRKAQEAAEGRTWQKFLRSSKFHFLCYCKERWPQLVATLKVWSELWHEFTPKAVIVSSLEDSESQLPVVAAERLNIPTISIPHGGFSPRAAVVQVADYILYNTSIQRSIYERADIAAQRLIACRDVVPDNEYPVVRSIKYRREKDWRILALINPIGTGCLAQRILPGAQLVALRALGNPPKDIEKHLSISIKVHPGFPDLELLASAGDELVNKVLPLDSELSDALNNSDLIIAANYCGSALIPALRAIKPVIFFWTDYLIGRAEPYTHADLLVAAGVVARDAKEVWDYARAFFTDRDFAGQLQSKASKYFRENLDDSNYPTISEVLEVILRER